MQVNFNFFFRFSFFVLFSFFLLKRGLANTKTRVPRSFTLDYTNITCFLDDVVFHADTYVKAYALMRTCRFFSFFPPIHIRLAHRAKTGIKYLVRQKYRQCKYAYKYKEAFGAARTILGVAESRLLVYISGRKLLCEFCHIFRMEHIKIIKNIRSKFKQIAYTCLDLGWNIGDDFESPRFYKSHDSFRIGTRFCLPYDKPSSEGLPLEKCDRHVVDKFKPYPCVIPPEMEILSCNFR